MPRLTQPKDNEPIRLLETGGGWRYEAAVTTSSPGARRTQARRRFATLKEARSFVAKVRTEVSSGTFPKQSDMTLTELGDLWLASKARPRQATLDGYAGDLRRAFGRHGDRPVRLLTAAELQGWVNAWPASGSVTGKGLSRRSMQINVQRLREVLTHGVKLEIIDTNPAQDLEVPRWSLEEENASRKRRTDAAVWTFGQLQQFVRAVDEDDLAVAWRLSAAGLRRSEVLGLDWTAVDLDAGKIHIVQARPRVKVDRVKAKLSRGTIELEKMVPGTLPLLTELWLRHGGPETNTVKFDRDGVPYGGGQDHLLVLDRVGRPYDRDLYSRAFTRICHEAGLPRIKLHAIRHTIASELHDRGVAPATGAALLRHSVETHLRNYVRSTPEHQQAAVAAFASAWMAEAEVQ
jgi:integrase